VPTPLRALANRRHPGGAASSSRGKISEISRGREKHGEVSSQVAMAHQRAGIVKNVVGDHQIHELLDTVCAPATSLASPDDYATTHFSPRVLRESSENMSTPATSSSSSGLSPQDELNMRPASAVPVSIRIRDHAALKLDLSRVLAERLAASEAGTLGAGSGLNTCRQPLQSPGTPRGRAPRCWWDTGTEETRMPQVMQQPPPVPEAVRCRSGSRRGRHLSPTAYMVEKITMQAARELSSNPPLVSCPMPDAEQGEERPSSPPLLLRAYAASSESSPSRSESSDTGTDVSESSDEEDIRDRLKNLLPLPAEVLPEHVECYTIASDEPQPDTEMVGDLSASATSVRSDDADADVGGASAPFASPATPIPHVLNSSPLSQGPEHLDWPADGIEAMASPSPAAEEPGEEPGGGCAGRLPWLSLPTPRPSSSPSAYAPLQASWPPSLEASPALEVAM